MTFPPVAILAGGLATRMSPATDTVPKSMLPVAGEPFIGHQLRLLSRQGVRDVVLCLGHLGAQVADHVGDGDRFGVSVRYAFDGEHLRGTGGALRGALPLLGSGFMVLYGDSYLDAPLRPICATFLRRRAPALMTIFRNDGRWGVSNVRRTQGHAYYDKRTPDAAMRHIDYGLSVIDTDAFGRCTPEASFDLADFYHQLSQRHELAAFEVPRRFYEIGTPAGLAETERYLLARSTPMACPAARASAEIRPAL